MTQQLPARSPRHAASLALALALLLTAIAPGKVPRLASAAPPAPAPAAIPSILGQVGGMVLGVAAGDGWLYAGVGPRLVVLRADGRQAPVEVGRSDVLPGPAFSMARVGDRMFVGTGYGGLVAVDLADRRRPRILGPVAGVPFVEQVVADARHVYAVGLQGLHVVDAFGAGLPRVVGHWRAEYIGLVDTLSGLVVAVDEQDLVVVDVGDPSAPRELARVAQGEYASAIVTKGTQVFVATQFGQLMIVDLAAPAQPRIRFQGPITAASNGLALAFAGDRLVMVAGEAGLQVLDVSDPSRPTDVGGMPVTPATHGFGRAAAEGNRLWVAGNEGGLDQFDIADPEAVAHSKVALDDWYVVDVDGVAGHAFAMTERGLRVLDTSVPADPRLVADFDEPGESLVRHGPRLYFGHLESTGGRSFRSAPGPLIYDISQPAAPRQTIGQTTWSPRAISDDGQVGFGGWGPVEIVDLTEPESPLLLGRVEGRGNIVAMSARGRTAFALTYEGALLAVDASEPRQARVVGQLQLDQAGSAMAAVGDRLYVLTGDELRVVDASNPAALRQTASLPLPSPAFHLAANADRLVVSVTLGAPGLLLYRLPHPDTPVFETRLALPDAASQVRLVGRQALLGSSFTGLWIADLGPVKHTRIYLPLARQVLR